MARVRIGVKSGENLGPYSAELEGRFPATSRRTLQRDLRGLLDKRLLREVASAPTDPTRRYERGPDLLPIA